MEYSQRTLETWRTSRLGCLYMNSFRLANTIRLGEQPDHTSNLETAAQVLSKRQHPEKRKLYSEIRRLIRSAQRNTEDGKYDDNVQLVLDLLNHYVGKVMEPGRLS